MVKHGKQSLATLWCGDAVRFDEDDRCRCPECRLKFHTEMAAWDREQLTQEEEPEASLMQFYKTKVAKGPARKRKTGKVPQNVTNPAQVLRMLLASAASPPHLQWDRMPRHLQGNPNRGRKPLPVAGPSPSIGHP